MNIIIVAVLASLGINLAAAGLIGYSSLDHILTLEIGIVLCFVPVGYFLAVILKQRERSRSMQGFLIVSKKDYKIFEAPRYDYFEKITNYFEGAFAENTELRELWNAANTKKEKTFGKNWAKYQADLQLMSKLIQEVTEYYILENLSIHLSEYFNEEDFKKENLIEIGRKDIPYVLLANRFLELFSRPMEERSKFIGPDSKTIVTITEEDNSHDGTREEVIFQSASGGVFYQKFDLLLPKGSVLSRAQDGKLVIDTKRFTLTIEVRFEGFGILLPRYFIDRYVGIPEGKINEHGHFHDFNDTYQVNADVSVKFKYGALLTPTGWEYFKWIDSFLDVLESSFSTSRFLKDIGWSTAETVIECLRKRSISKAEKSESTEAQSKKTRDENAVKG